MFKIYLITLALWVSPLSATATSNDLAQQQKALVATLEKIITDHLGISACDLSTVDSDSAFVVQIYCPKAATSRLLGQSGAFMRSVKILFNDLYLDWQQQHDKQFNWEKAKKMHLRFIEKE